MLQSIPQTNPIWNLAPEVVVSVSGNQSPVSWQPAQYLLGPHKTPLLRARVTTGQVNPTSTPDEQKIACVVDSVTVEGDVTGSVTGLVSND